MATWHPPIPAEAVYRSEVAALGAGLRLLWYLYNGVRRDGTAELSIRQASESLSTAYDTVRNWWQALKPLGIVTIIEDRGKNGFVLKFGEDWIDWHVLSANYERSDLTVENTLKDAQSIFNGSSTVFERSNLTVEGSAYKVLIDSDLAEREERAPRATHSPKKPKAEKAHDPTLDHLAVITYRATFKRTPNADQRQAIAMAVTDNDLWSEICALWKQNRWDYLKVENLINRYQKNGTHNGNANGRIRSHSRQPLERTQWRESTDDEAV